MPKQKGPNKFTGSMGDLSFYHDKLNGYLIRTKGGPSKKQIKKGKEFDITRRNMSEFGRASAYGKLLRHGFHPLIHYCYDGTLHYTLPKRIREIMNMDDKSEYGKRDLRKDTLAAFRHFELDSKSLSSKYFEHPVDVELHKETLDVYAGIRLGRKPAGIDAWQLVSVAAGIKYGKSVWDADVKRSDIFIYEAGGFGVSFHHYCNEDHFVFHGMCIVFLAYDPVTDEYKPVPEEHVNAGFIRYAGEYR